MRRGDVWWARMRVPHGSEPGRRRPVLVIQADNFNETRLNTVVVVALTSNVRLAAARGNVHLPAGSAGLPRESVVNVTQVATLDRAQVTQGIGHLAPDWLAAIEEGVRRVLGL